MRKKSVEYSAAVVATVAATLLRMALTPLIGDATVPFITFFPAVLFSAWYGGFRAGLLGLLLSAIAADYFFTAPVRTLLIGSPVDQFALLIFILVGFGMTLLSRAQSQAVEYAQRQASLRKDAEAAERLQRQQLETTLASIGDGVIATDERGHVSFMNRVAESLTGWTQENALGQPLESIFRIVNEDTRQTVENPALRAMRDGRIVGLANHTVLIANSGAAIPIDDSGAPVIGPDGKVSGAVLIFRDITERRRTDKQRELLAEQARILNSGFDAIILRDINDRIVSWNRVAEDLYGWTADEAVGQIIHVLLKTQFPKPFDEITKDLHRDNRWEGELVHTRRDGSTTTVLSHWILNRDRQGQPLSVLQINIDISARKQAEEEVRAQRELLLESERNAREAESRARRTAEEANRAKDEFLAVLSHELRNPLSSILGWAVILRTGQIPLEEAGHALEVIERNARIEAQLVESLLDLSRIAAGKLKLDTERVDLVTVIQAVADSLRPAADKKGITLDVAVPPSPLDIVGDSGRLQQIFSNLLTNAIKFTSPGGHVQVRVNRAGSQAQIQVIDDGEGMDADFLPLAFERFRQAESTKVRAHGGLGLGLAIVRELVHAHGGSVAADSPGKGRGSTFTVTLPIPALIPAHLEMANLQLERAEEPSISGLRILVVDDDADARELIGLALESRGAAVCLASSAAEALDFVKQQEPDVMIADIGMPQEDGYVLIQKLRAFEREQSVKRLPAIALTAYASVTDRDQALAAGYDFHLAKPVGPADLTHAVTKFRKHQGA